MRVVITIDPREYSGKYVALDLRDPRNITIIDSANDPDELLERLKRKGVDLRYIDIDYVYPEDVHIL